MTKSKLTLIIDGNWLLMSRLSVIVNKYNDVNIMNKELNLLMIRSINLVLKTFPIIDNVIFVTDYGSWRNSIENVPNFLLKENIHYKGNRIRTDEYDWDSIFENYENFIKILDENGINVCKEKEVEGDDWCAYWSKKLNSEQTNVIIWSKDKDLQQLVNTDNNGYFTICWNKENGVICMDKNEDEFNFLFNNEFSENDKLLNFIYNKSSNITKINPNNIILDKIIRGDVSDNIIPIILRSTNSSRKYKVSSKNIDKSLDIFNDEEIKKYINNICELKNYKNKILNKTKEEIYEHFIYNRQLVCLNKKVYPQYILDILNKYELKTLNKDFSKIEYILAAKKSNIDNILELI